MNDIIKFYTKKLYRQSHTKRYEITHEGLELLFSLKPRSQELFLDLLQRIGHSNTFDDILIECTYKDLGFNSFGNFSRYRSELASRKLLFFENNKYFINPAYVDFYTRRQKEFFLKLFNIKKTINVTMKVPPRLKVC